ncbi:MAG: restriction endonuclease subunit S [Actinobacteria bacterium]|nr:restriction endonuclease subunit S [Actinomycetota bacterium]MCL5883256.1 restriction endonuclease subunit S [Actinomycetota bacterium]
MSRRNANRPGHKKTKVGWIPDDWECVQLRTVSDVKTGPFGAQLHERDYVEDGTPIVTVEHLGEQGLVYQNLPRVSEIDKKRLAPYVLQQGDIVFSRVGSVDRNSLIRKSEEGWLFSGRLLRIRPQGVKLDSAFLSAFFHLSSFKHYVRSIAVGGTMRCLNTSLLSQISVPLPNKAEQKKIAEILSTWDRAIEQTRELIDAKKLLKKGLMQQLLTGRMRFPEFGEPVLEILELSAGWLDAKLGDCLLRIVGGGTPARDKGAFWGGSIPWATVKDISAGNVEKTQECISQLGLQSSSANLIPPNINIIATRMAVGSSIRFTRDVAINQDLKALFPKKEMLSGDYLKWLLLYKEAHLSRLGGGSTVNGIRLVELKGLKIKLPEISEQRRISGVLFECDKEIELLTTEVSFLSDQKKGLMQKLLTGEVRVKLPAKAAS